MKKLMPLAALAMLAGCGEEEGAQQAVREILKDPDSARFGEFYYNSDTKKACLGVNAKNSMGGYTGETQATLVNGEKGWVYIYDAELSHEDCKKLYADKADD